MSGPAASAGGPTIAPARAYDLAGNMTKVPRPGAEDANHFTCTYDAWNRLVKVQNDDASATVAEYRYDGLNRRIAKLLPNGQNWKRTDFFYDEAWQVVEERYNDSQADANAVATATKAKYVWDIRYIDAPVVRWWDQSGDGDFDEPNEVHYYCNDFNANVTALVAPDGNVVERYRYDPYGKVTVMDGDWNVRSSGSAYANEILYCGYRYDPETGNYQVRNRFLAPGLGRWLQRDPGLYVDGVNLYEYAAGGPEQSRDPGGLKATTSAPATGPGWHAYTDPRRIATVSFPTGILLDQERVSPANIKKLTASATIYAETLDKMQAKQPDAYEQFIKATVPGTAANQVPGRRIRIWFAGRIFRAIYQICPCLTYSCSLTGRQRDPDNNGDVDILGRVPLDATGSLSKKTCECFRAHPVGCGIILNFMDTPITIKPFPGLQPEWMLEGSTEAEALRSRVVLANVWQDPTEGDHPGSLSLVHEGAHILTRIGDLSDIEAGRGYAGRTLMDLIAKQVGEEFTPRRSYPVRGLLDQPGLQEALAYWTRALNVGNVLPIRGPSGGR